MKAVRMFVPVFAAILSAAIIIFLFLAAKTKFDRWEVSKEEALRVATKTQIVRDRAQRSLSAETAKPVDVALGVEGLTEELNKTRQAIDDLVEAASESSAAEQQQIYILLHKPFLPLTADEQKIVNDYKSYLDKEFPNYALIERPVKVANPDGGKATLEPGLMFEVKSKTNSTVRIQYHDSEREIPISATYLTHEKAPPTPKPQKSLPDAVKSKAPEVAGFITLVKPVNIQTGSGAVTLEVGISLPFVSRDGDNVRFHYENAEYEIPVDATDLAK
jgi:hypothetical protein